MAFSAIFPKDVSDPALAVNGILNYVNEYIEQPNCFILKIGGTDERKRKKKFGSNILGLSDVSKMFTKQPIYKETPNKSPNMIK